MSDGFCRKSCRPLNSPWPVVPPNAAGARSDMSNRNDPACDAAISAWADRRLMSSGYADRLTLLFGEVNPPAWIHGIGASGEARYWISAFAAGLSLNRTAMSPPPTTEGPDPLIDGKSKKLMSVPSFAPVSAEM